MEIAAAARFSAECARQLRPARKQNARFFRIFHISFVQGATHSGAVFDAETGASGSHSPGLGRQGCDRYGPDRNRQGTGVSNSRHFKDCPHKTRQESPRLSRTNARTSPVGEGLHEKPGSLVFWFDTKAIRKMCDCRRLKGQTARSQGCCSVC